MKILVCVKQVPDTNEVKIDPVKGTLIRDGVPSILNPEDAHALEGALAIKDRIKDTIVDVISMGPPQADIMLRECLAMGADNAYLLSDRAFGGADTCATSQTLAYGINKIGSYDIIFAGRQAIDGDTAQVGPQLAQRMGLPVITYVSDVNIEKDNLIVKRQADFGEEIIEVKMPAVLTAIKELNTPRYMSVMGIEDAYNKKVTILSHTDVSLSPTDCGLTASPTQVMRSFTPPVKGKGEMLSGTVSEMSAALIGSLKAKHIIK